MHHLPQSLALPAIHSITWLQTNHELSLGPKSGWRCHSLGLKLPWRTSQYLTPAQPLPCPHPSTGAHACAAMQFACPAWKTDEFTARTGQAPVLLHFVTVSPLLMR